MKKKQFKAFYKRLRMIRNASMVGTHGHYSDLVVEFNVTIEFIRALNYMSKKKPRLVYGKYTTEYQDRMNDAADWDAYGERMIGA